jgi:hypothetical protein
MIVRDIRKWNASKVLGLEFSIAAHEIKERLLASSSSQLLIDCDKCTHKQCQGDRFLIEPHCWASRESFTNRQKHSTLLRAAVEETNASTS